MPTLNEYFRDEAREFLRGLERAISAATPDAAEVHRATRALRGSAQMAREERIYRAAAAFESVTRSLAAGALTWSAEMTERARATLGDLRALLEQSGDPSELDARAEAAANRWQAPSRPPATPAAEPDAGLREFREFTAREVANIADTIDQGIQALHADPMDREPLRAILRRQRTLLGAARLDEVPVVAEILRAVEDLSRVIAKLDVGVKQEWLDIFRVARDGLQATIATLVRGGNPEPSHAVSRLRHMRAELLERYGEGEAVSVAHESQLVQAMPMPAPGVNGHAAADEPVLELDSAAVVEDEPVLDLTDAPVVEDEAVLELSDAAIVEDEAMLDLSDATVVEDEPMLELTDAAIVEDEAVLELSDAAIVAGDAVLELSDAAIVEHEGLLELNDEAVAEDEQILELDDAAAADGAVLELNDAAIVRARAAELRSIIERATSHDPQARRAVEELFQLLDSAIE